MADLSAFPITRRWPAKHADRLQLYSLPTPNGVKVSIALEELGIPYEPHTINIGANETWTEEFLSLNPNGKIPAIIDPDGPGGKPLGLFESGAILLYLAEKTGKLLPKDAAHRYETIEWVFFQMASIGPMFGQVGFFHKFAGREYEDKRPLQRYVTESKRLVGVLEGRLRGRPCSAGSISRSGRKRRLREGTSLREFDRGLILCYRDPPRIPRAVAEERRSLKALEREQRLHHSPYGRRDATLR